MRWPWSKKPQEQPPAKKYPTIAVELCPACRRQIEWMSGTRERYDAGCMALLRVCGNCGYEYALRGGITPMAPPTETVMVEAYWMEPL